VSRLSAVICGSRITSPLVIALPQCESVGTRVGARRNGFSAGAQLAGAEGTLKIVVGELELDLVGTPRGQGEVNAANAGAHLSAELENLQANGPHGGIGELSMAQADAAQRVDEHVGHLTPVPSTRIYR
jgi:hypothetical protein